MNGTATLLRSKRNDILRVSHEHGARNVRVFGSAGRDEATDRSDIDLLVELEPGYGLLHLAELKLALGDLLGREVDVVCEEGLYWLLKRRILKEAKPL